MKSVSLFNLFLSLIAVTSASARNLRKKDGDNAGNKQVLANLVMGPTAKVEFLQIGDTIAMVASAETKADSTLLKIVMNAATKDNDPDVNDVQTRKDPIKLYKKIAEFAQDDNNGNKKKTKSLTLGGKDKEEKVPKALLEAAEKLKQHQTDLEDVEDDVVMVAQDEDQDEEDQDDENDGYGGRHRRLFYFYCNSWLVTGNARVHRHSNNIMGEVSVRYGNSMVLVIDQKLCSRCQWQPVVAQRSFYTMLEIFSPSYTWLRARTELAYDDIYNLSVCW